jgi:hypothetical protein
VFQEQLNVIHNGDSSRTPVGTFHLGQLTSAGTGERLLTASRAPGEDRARQVAFSTSGFGLGMRSRHTEREQSDRFRGFGAAAAPSLVSMAVESTQTGAVQLSGTSDSGKATGVELTQEVSSLAGVIKCDSWVAFGQMALQLHVFSDATIVKLWFIVLYFESLNWHSGVTDWQQQF